MIIQATTSIKLTITFNSLLKILQIKFRGKDYFILMDPLSIIILFLTMYLINSFVRKIVTIRDPVMMANVSVRRDFLETTVLLSQIY